MSGQRECDRSLVFTSTSTSQSPMPEVLTSTPHLSASPSASSSASSPRYDDSPSQRSVASALNDFERAADDDAAASISSSSPLSTTSSNDYNRYILAAASAGSVGAFAWTVRRNLRRDAAGQAVDPYLAAQAASGGPLRNPKLVVYTYAGGAFATATALVGLGAFALLTGLSSYFGVNSVSSDGAGWGPGVALLVAVMGHLWEYWKAPEERRVCGTEIVMTNGIHDERWKMIVNFKAKNRGRDRPRNGKRTKGNGQ
ncbi:hypothetical protein M427DRAFT_380510 [Gonapodya prolifera JEL478]|uniref:Uncharacterized protein n=1 Tax=Gonapodya prolifera (strain JEL478) TaxID=1344416 RepID=A0A139AV98_GONPJ|nr:hypothetical protein M427DRAFT_380510 [Gonapodya prolifera JEL478]|eukprot:KXS20660.1 hypothetical protein M427DRAFT_380510 [Gonapodya prolifera JEL478]